MKKYILSLFVCSVMVANAQVKKSSTDPAPKIGAYPDKDVVVYKNALSLGDLETATYSLHNIIAANPNGAIYKDTLAIVYLQRGYFRQAQLLTKTLYLEKENDTRTEILALCAKQLNQPTEAIDLYKKLYNSTKKENYAFEQLQLEYSIKRLAEAKLTAQQLIKTLPINDQLKLTTSKSDKSEQVIDLKAGVYFILGNINNELKNTEEAKNAYQEALKINPEYENASVALSALK
jgi:tetratricopeptide (TPR) repeat protein